MLRLVLCLVASLALVAANAADPAAQPEIQWRFVGGRALQTQTNAPVLKKVLTLPETSAVGPSMSRHLAETWWRIATGTTNMPAVALEAGVALAQDLLQSASAGEVLRGKAGREVAVALQLPADRVAVWEKRWPIWAGAVHAIRGPSSASKPQPQLLRRDSWVLAVSDVTTHPMEATLTRLTAPPSSPGSLLHWRSVVPGHPAVELTFVPTNGNVRVEGTLRPIQPIPEQLPEWMVPGFIREPLVQFTAARGLGPLTAGWLDPKSSTGSGWPNQMFVWGQPNQSYRYPYFAAQYDDPTGYLKRLHGIYRGGFAPESATPRYKGELYANTNRLVLAGGIPLAPMMEAMTREKRPLVTLAMIPLVKTTNPPSPEMLSQMNRPEMLVYDFEFTSDSIRQWNAALQLPDLLEGRSVVTTTPAVRWLLAAGPLIGECVTTVTRKDATHALIRRKSPVGLSGLELALLAKWLDPIPPIRLGATNTPAKTRN
ncbi:MAG: hypothetical protein ACKO3H_09810 [Verrucomicrobiota bacterium]